jgi:hypothetical protein
MTNKYKRVYYINGDEVVYRNLTLNKTSGIYEATTLCGGKKLIPFESVNYVEVEADPYPVLEEK